MSNTQTDRTSAGKEAFARETKQVASSRLEQRLEAQIQSLESQVDQLLQIQAASPETHAKPQQPTAVNVWEVPFSRLTFAETLQHIDDLVVQGEPGYFITANLNYVMLSHRHPGLKKVNTNASFITCDGMPMVWWSRIIGRRLPERVAGSELIYALSKLAAIKGHRIFFLGGAPGVARGAAEKLSERYPGLQIAGVESPPFRPLTDDEQAELLTRIRATKPDILFVALGQPKGEQWLAEHYRALGAAASVQLGASFDFVVGGIPRAPRWLQKAGLEWAYRLHQEPRRLAKRYAQNALFLAAAVTRDLATAFWGRRASH